MTFQALARTWRPRRFDQLVGQTHVVRALTHALDHDKLHHALLFSGTRGVGKTTLGRIIAKCLNCERGVSATPCPGGDDACGTCREIDEGRFVDLIEVDAASRTGVDDTRELMDNVQYAPTRGRTKVYLIDEVHMLTKHSFNALLKTLEEPPPRVQFLLATTEPEKIPVTILSRCLQFPLKRLPVPQIADRLRHILEVESLSADEDAITALARAADGSMRDGLSLLDQAIAFSGGHLAADGVRDMLGTIGESRVAELVDAIIAAESARALAALEALYAQGIDMRHLLDALATAWQHIATVQVVGEPIDDESARWQTQAEQLDPRMTQVFYDITLTGIRDLTYAPDPLLGARMCVLRLLAFCPAAMSSESDESGETPVSGGRQTSESARDAVARARAQLQSQSADAPSENRSTPAGPLAADVPHRVDAGAKAAEPDAPMAASNALPAAADAAPEPPRPSAEPPLQAEAPSAVPPDSETITETDAVSPPLQSPSHAPDADANAVRETSPGADPAPATPEQPPEAEPESHASGSETVRAPAADAEFDFAAGADHPEDWHSLVPTLDLKAFGAQLAQNGTCRHLDNARVVLEIERVHAWLATDDARNQLQSALAAAWGAARAPRLVVNVVESLDDTPAKRDEANAQKRQQAAVASIENDPIVQRLRRQLGARLRTETIRPHRSPGAMQPRDDQ